MELLFMIFSLQLLMEVQSDNQENKTNPTTTCCVLNRTTDSTSNTDTQTPTTIPMKTSPIAVVSVVVTSTNRAGDHENKTNSTTTCCVLNRTTDVPPTRDALTISEGMWISLLFSGLLSAFVLTGLLCYCMGRYTSRETKRQEPAKYKLASGPEGTNSVNAYGPDTSQHTDPLVNIQHKKQRTEEKENVHHVYSTIPDKPVNTVAADQHIYSLA